MRYSFACHWHPKAFCIVPFADFHVLAFHPVILYRWDPEFIGLLLLVVALVSVVVLKFFMLKADRSVLGAASRPNQATLPRAAGASLTAPNENDGSASSTQRVASGNTSTFDQDFQLAVQLKTDNKPREAGQSLSRALGRDRMHYVALQSINEFCRTAAAKDGLSSICCRKDQGHSNLTSFCCALTLLVGAG